MSDRKKLVLIDGNSITYRAFFSLPPLSNSKGQITNAAYGFTLMLMRLLQDEQPTHLVVAFDKGKPNFRQEVYSEYKGTREKTPSELSEQFPLVRDILESFGIPYVELQGYEADDLIGTMTKQAEAGGYESLVVTGDKDLLQIVSDKVTTMLTRKGVSETETYTPADVAARYDGLTPLQIIDLKGLMGDSSDNIPGIPGVGEKTALKLLAQHPTVEDVLAHADQAPGKKLQEKLREHADAALMSKKLATILRDVPMELDLEAFLFGGYDANKVRETFKRLEFKSLLDRLPAGGVEEEAEEQAPAHAEVETKVIGAGELAGVIGSLPETVGVWLDLEGNYQIGFLKGIALATAQEAWYLPVDEIIPNEMVRLFQDGTRTKAIYDVKAVSVALRNREFIKLDAQCFDTLLSSYLLHPSDGAPDLYDVIERHLGWKIAQPPKGAAKKTTEWSVEDRARHAGAIAAANVLMQERLTHQLEISNLTELYRDLELPLSYVLSEMEALGVRIDTEELRAIGTELKGRIEDLQKEIFADAGVEFNLNSPKQLGEVLFEKLGLPTGKKTKTGYSTSADVLEKLAEHSPVVKKILEFRQLGKLNSTYVEGLLGAARENPPGTFKVHTQFNQALTATGRLSSTEPNLQNIPIRTEEGRRLRKVFVPSEAGWKILAADYSQIELRILAHIAGDENMIDAFVNEEDIHTRTAADVFDVPVEEVDSNMRRAAKAVNFGIVYGISDFGLSQNLNIPRKQAAQFIDKYFERFGGVKQFMSDVVEQARRDGYVTTLLGRMRHLPDINASNFNIRSFAERTAMNTPIQGTAADIIKKAMVNVAEKLREENLRARMLLQVHDELIFECPEDEIEQLQELVRREMEGVIILSVPLKADINVGSSWYEAK